MLVLSRHCDETIMIGDEVEVTIVDIRGDKVRVGITAPSHITVHRREIYDAIRLENEQASGLSSNPIGTIHPEDHPTGNGRVNRGTNGATRVTD